ncbi:MAG: dihydropteroate synthase [Bacteroidales bacterium]|nr:dihydropteroate synthase [Bacteroidales bacterium]
MNFKDTFFSKKSTLNCRGKLLDLSTPRIMGIINVTPDSFYDGGRYSNDDHLHKKIDQLFSEGTDIIDVGAYSSRPGAADITPDDEKKRLLPALLYIRKHYPDVLISVDTFRSSVASMAISDYDVDIVNDITAGLADARMLETIAYHSVPYVMMHMQGTPATMQANPVYENIIKDIIAFFADRLQMASSFGIKDVIIDPGFGFGKTIRHNYELLHGLKAFTIFEIPVMAGLSRKSMIYKYLEITPERSLNGTTVLNTLALLNGANLLRVHDVKEAKETIRLYQKYMEVESMSSEQ